MRCNFHEKLFFNYHTKKLFYLNDPDWACKHFFAFVQQNTIKKFYELISIHSIFLQKLEVSFLYTKLSLLQVFLKTNCVKKQLNSITTRMTYFFIGPKNFKVVFQLLQYTSCSTWQLHSLSYQIKQTWAITVGICLINLS